MLWDAAGSNLNQTITPYSGQGILKNFRFEVWNTLQGAASQATSIDIFTSVLNKFDWRYATDSILKASDTEVTNFNYNASLPYQSPGFRLLNAGTAAVNGIYTQTNEPFGVLYNGRLVYSNGLYIIRYESNRWNIFALNTTLYYHANNNYYNPIAPNLSIWIADAGSNPAPTAQLLGQPVYMGVFNLPLTFPTNSVSTTN
jgi:hypothetical protein